MTQFCYNDSKIIGDIMIDANNNTIPNGANTAIVGADNKSGSGSENKSNAEKEAKNNFLLEFL